MNRLEVRKTLLESGIQASGNQIDRAIESLGLPAELQPEHVDRLKAHFQATTRPNGKPHPRMTSKTELLQQLGMSEADFDAKCNKWSVAIDKEYTPNQVAWFKEHFGGQFKTEELRSDEPAPKQATGFSAIQDQVNGAISGLKQAELALAASAFERLNNQFQVDTDRISQAAEVLLDPRVKIATGILKAANRINDRQEEPLQIPFGGYQFELPQIPGLPDFGQFYSQQQQSDRLLSVGTNGNGQSGQSNDRNN